MPSSLSLSISEAGISFILAPVESVVFPLESPFAEPMAGVPLSGSLYFSSTLACSRILIVPSNLFPAPIPVSFDLSPRVISTSALSVMVMFPFILPLSPEPIPEPTSELAVTVASPPMVIEPFSSIFPFFPVPIPAPSEPEDAFTLLPEMLILPDILPSIADPIPAPSPLEEAVTSPPEIVMVPDISGAMPGLNPAPDPIPAP